jgi:hypothetical protein
VKSVETPYIRLRGVNEDQIIGQEQPEFANAITNMEYQREGYWQPVPGVTTLSATFSGSTTVWEMVLFRPRPGVVRLVAEHGTLTSAFSTLSWWHPGGAAQIDLTTTRRRSGGYWRVQPWLQVGGWLCHFNGLQQPVRWDGDRLAPFGYVAPPSAPQMASVSSDTLGFFDVAAAILNGGGTYNYKRLQRGVGEYTGSAETAPYLYAYGKTIINDRGQESPMSGLSWVTGENDQTYGRRMNRIRSLTEADHIRGVRIWRSTNLYGVDTVSGTPTMYLQSEWMTGAEFDLFDHTPDGELGIAFDPDAVGTVPFEAHSPVLFQNTLFVAVGDRVHFSYPGLIEQFPSQNYLPLPRPEVGRIRAMHGIASGVLVFTERSTSIIKGNPASGFRIELLSDRVGTTAPAAIVSVPNRGTFFVSSEGGPHMVRGTLEDSEPTAVEPVRGLGRTWAREYRGADLSTAAGFYRPEVDEVWWQLPERGDWMPTRGHVLHLEIGGWSTRLNWTWQVALPGGLFGGPSAAAAGGKVWMLRGSGVTSDGTSISGVYETATMSSSTPRELQKLDLAMVAVGDIGIVVDLKLNRALTWTTNVCTRAALHPHDAEPEVGGELLINQPARVVREVWKDTGNTTASGLWSTTRLWVDYEPVSVPFTVGQGKGVHHQLRFTTTAARLAGITPRWNPKDGGGAPLPEREP